MAEYRQAGFLVIGEAVVDELVAVLPLGVEGFLGAGEGECRAVDGAVGLVDQVELLLLAGLHEGDVAEGSILGVVIDKIDIVPDISE